MYDKKGSEETPVGNRVWEGGRVGKLLGEGHLKTPISIEIRICHFIQKCHFEVFFPPVCTW